MVQVVRLINHFFWFPGDTETELSKNSRGCSAHGNLLPSIKEKYSVLPGPAGVMKGSPRPSQKSHWCRTRTKKAPLTNKTLGLEPAGAVQGECRREVSRDPSSSPITKPHGVKRGQPQHGGVRTQHGGGGQDSAWRGQDSAWGGAGLSVEGAALSVRGPAHTPRGQRAQRAPPSHSPPPRPQHEATAGLGLFQHKRRRVHAGMSTVSLALAAGHTAAPTAGASLPGTPCTAPRD